MLLVALSAPILGAIADYTASKKRFLFAFCYVGVLATAFLFLAGPGDIWLAVFFYLLSNMGMEWSLTFYNGFLPEIASREKMGRISGFGWALGYVGGVLCLLLNMAMIQRPDWFGLPDSNYIPIRASLVVVALWWGIFSIPTFVWLRERAQGKQRPPGTSYLKIGFQRLALTLRKVRQFRELVKFLVAFLIYNDGVQTVIVMAAVFGAEVLHMPQEELILCFILIHVVAFFWSAGFRIPGRSDDDQACHQHQSVALVRSPGLCPHDRPKLAVLDPGSGHRFCPGRNPSLFTRAARSVHAAGEQRGVLRLFLNRRKICRDLRPGTLRPAYRCDRFRSLWTTLCSRFSPSGLECLVLCGRGEGNSRESAGRRGGG